MKNKTEHVIKIYDFDNTIYDGDSMIDFYFFNLRKQPTLIRYLPMQVLHSCLFFLGFENRTNAKMNFFKYLKSINDIERRSNEFWKLYDSKLKDWYSVKNHSRDVIITASPEFLIFPIASKLGIYRLVATTMNAQTGEITGHNCYGEEKVNRLKKLIPNAVVEEAYSDNMCDMPLLRLAEKKFIVLGNSVISLQEYNKMSNLIKLKTKYKIKMFL